MSQERKKELAPAIKDVLKKYNLKGSIWVENHSKLRVTIREWQLDFAKYARHKNEYNRNRLAVNEYWIDDMWDGEARDCLKELKSAMMRGNYNNSDPMTDYFDVGRYISIEIGDYDKPYKLI